MTLPKRKDYIYGILLTLLFVALTKMLPFWIIENQIATIALSSKSRVLRLQEHSAGHYQKYSLLS